MYYQQGDVILRRVSELPIGLELQHGDKVLQHGETTGHRHMFDSNAAVDIYHDMSSVPEDGGRITQFQGERYLRVVKPSLLLHEEHKPIEIASGIYKQDIVREYDYTEMRGKRVVD